MNIPSEYSLNVTEFPIRKINKIWNPSSIQELKEIILSANQKGTPVYPISTGHNWGLGSKLPIVDADIIDLKKLNKIIEVNESLAYARIQPGVTQIQLAKYLQEHHPQLILNVTGSDAHSSILGNSIDRGSGKNGQRANDIRELTVMNGVGDEFTTGFGSFPNKSKGSFYKYGLGPDLTHLFTQSNMGIVTEAVINLLPKQAFNLYLGTISKNDLGDFLHSFSNLVRNGVVGNTLEIDSQNDPKIFELFESQKENEGNWICWFAIYGTDEILEAKDFVITKELGGKADLKKYPSNENHSTTPAPVQVRISRYSGIPNDHSLISTAKAFGVDLPTDNPDIDMHKMLPGFRCVLPVIPFAQSGAEIIDLIYGFSKGTKFDPVISIIGLDNYALEVFARIYFDRNNKDEINLAGNWASGLYEELKKEGIYPYRLDIENMIPYLSNVNDPLITLKENIKKHLDPNGIIAPGRYHLISDK
ncbi:FAD-binding oxidoreductase [Ekhidna sp.]|uniref:FAD-binding oxidoreductase n=1 Tax=Ekhidna sp. TaxID=2608089 RepID=UPI003B50AA39